MLYSLTMNSEKLHIIPADCTIFIRDPTKQRVDPGLDSKRSELFLVGTYDMI
jgi:hypothetical protein